MVLLLFITEKVDNKILSFFKRAKYERAYAAGQGKKNVQRH
jgi:hypothetical protein